MPCSDSIGPGRQSKRISLIGKSSSHRLGNYFIPRKQHTISLGSRLLSGHLKLCEYQLCSRGAATVVHQVQDMVLEPRSTWSGIASLTLFLSTAYFDRNPTKKLISWRTSQDGRSPCRRKPKRQYRWKSIGGTVEFTRPISERKSCWLKTQNLLGIGGPA